MAVRGDHYTRFSDCKGDDILIFHHADADGAAAAAIIMQIYPKAWAYPVNHNKPVRWDLIYVGNGLQERKEGRPRESKFKTVFVVDFSFDLRTMQDLNVNHRLIWIDHHEPINEYPKLDPAMGEVDGLRRIDVSESGAMLTWRFMHMGPNEPMSLKHISKADTWQFDYGDDTSAFTAALLGMKLMPIQGEVLLLWDKLLRDKEYMEKLLLAGRELIKYTIAYNEVTAKFCGFNTKILGIDAQAINVKDANSHILHAIKDRSPYQILYRYYHNVHATRMSIYTDRSDYSAADVAQMFGGNGREGCAGCLVNFTNPPFVLPEPVPHTELPYDDPYVPIRHMACSSPKLMAFATSGLPAVIFTSKKASNLNGMNVVAVNHPHIYPQVWFDLNMHQEFDIAVTWVMTKYGWYLYKYYPLNDMSLEELSEKVYGRIVGQEVWHWDRSDLFDREMDGR